jgi:hypothetical protein
MTIVCPKCEKRDLRLIEPHEAEAVGDVFSAWNETDSTEDVLVCDCGYFSCLARVLDDRRIYRDIAYAIRRAKLEKRRRARTRAK